MRMKTIWSGSATFILASLFSLNLFAAAAGYDKGFYIKSDDGDFKIKTNIQLMPQYQFVSIEGQGKVNTFQIRKARIIWSGHAFYPDLTYKFQVEILGGRVSTATEGDGLTGPNLRDAWINYQFTDGIGLKAGQFKPSYNREELTSSSKLQFVDRSINNETFTLGRALGLTIHGKPFDKKMEYALYAVNDVTRRNGTNRNNEMDVGGRFVWNALGHHGYKMSDVKWHEDPALAFGVAGALGFPTTADPTMINASADVAFKYSGWSFHGEGNYQRDQTAKTNIIGFLGQVGYFLVPEHFEIAARGAGVIPKGGGTNGYETGLTLNYFFKGHNLKIQSDYALLWNSALVLNGANAPSNVNRGGLPGFVQNQNDHRARVQAQLYF